MAAGGAIAGALALTFGLEFGVLIMGLLTGAPRRLVWNATITISGRGRALWTCGQAAFEPVHMSIGPSSRRCTLSRARKNPRSIVRGRRPSLPSPACEHSSSSNLSAHPIAHARGNAIVAFHTKRHRAIRPPDVPDALARINATTGYWPDRSAAALRREAAGRWAEHVAAEDPCPDARLPSMQRAAKSSSMPGRAAVAAAAHAPGRCVT